MSWFSTEEELSIWSGPGFRYPFDLSSFKEDLKLDSLKSFSFVSHERKLLAFGQYYPRLGKCHLGRLVVNPNLATVVIHSGQTCSPSFYVEF